jgi:hypothetical protein
MLTAANHMYNCALNFAEPANRNSIQVDRQCLKNYAQKGIFLMSGETRKYGNPRFSHYSCNLPKIFRRDANANSYMSMKISHTWKQSLDVFCHLCNLNHIIKITIRKIGLHIMTVNWRLWVQFMTLFSVLLLFATKFSFDLNKFQK